MTREPRFRPGAVGIATAIAATTASCNLVLDYPEERAEIGTSACSDGTDNDFDGRIDCADRDCDGYCPEQTPDACVDGIDNDGDGYVDGADPRCWPGSSPAVTRCASWAPFAFAERFDAEISSARWHRFGVLPDTAEPVVERQEPVNRDDRPDGVLGFNPKGPVAGQMGGIASVSLLDGDWTGMELTFQAFLEQDGYARVGWVPAGFVPEGQGPTMGAEDAAVLVVLDATVSPSVALQAGQQTVVAAWLAPETWHEVRLASDGADLSLTVDAVEVARLPLPPVVPARLVVWGESIPRGGGASAVQFDDLRVRLPGTRPCDGLSPQIPLGTSCRDTASVGRDDVGYTVSAAVGADGSLCAVTTASARGVSGASTVQSWISHDRVEWIPGGVVTEVEADLVGAAVAFDDGSNSFRVVLAERAAKSVELTAASGPDCATWSTPEPVAWLPQDSEAPSYLVPGFAAKHEVCFTRPPSGSSGRTVWCARSEDGVHFALEDAPVAAIPDDAHAAAPFAISRIGGDDAVAVYPILPSAGVAGLGMLVAMDASWSRWERSSAWPVLSPDPFRGGFDSQDIVSGTVVWSGEQGTILYGARGWPDALSNEAGGSAPLSVGTAALTTGEHGGASSIPHVWCGDGRCEAGEDCAACEIDCGGCEGETVLRETFDSEVESWRLEAPPGSIDVPSLRVSAIHGALLAEPKNPGWLVRALPALLLGDFDLSFDVHVVPTPSADASCVLAVGVGESPSSSVVDPRGVFVRVETQHPCDRGVPAFSPVARIEPRRWQPPELGREVEGQDCESAMEGMADRWHRVTLSRRGQRVSVAVRGPDGCSLSELGVEYAGALAFPEALLVGYPGTFDRMGWRSCASDTASIAIDNLRLSTPSCAPGAVECADPETGGKTCADLTSSNEHCGACFTPVLAAEACEDGDRVCKGTLCTDATSGQETCVDLDTDANHCGACGVKLTEHEECSGGLRLPKMKQVPEGFWIDTTEVTRAQYAAWLATKPSYEDQHPGCAGWHNNYTPICGWPPGASWNFPVHCIDWCDAFGYCASVGKRLCGAVGGGPASTTGTANQSYAVCSSGGQYLYPDGDLFNPETCWMKGNPDVACVQGTTSPFCSFHEVPYESCQSSVSGYEGVYDLVGNAHEFLDACTGELSRSDTCSYVGGAVEAGNGCKHRFTKSREMWDVNQGIRCCAW